MFKENKICQMLGIKYPVFQGGMAWLGTAELVSAVSNAGGLGSSARGICPRTCSRQKSKRQNH